MILTTIKKWVKLKIDAKVQSVFNKVLHLERTSPEYKMHWGMCHVLYRLRRDKLISEIEHRIAISAIRSLIGNTGNTGNFLSNYIVTGFTKSHFYSTHDVRLSIYADWANRHEIIANYRLTLK